MQEVGRFRCELPLIAAVRATAVSGIIDYDPAPVPGSVVSRRSPLEALSSSCRPRFPAFRALEVARGAPGAPTFI